MIDLPLDRALLTALIATGGVLLLMPLAIRLAPRLGMVDDPTRDARRQHAEPVPRIGGVAVILVLAAVLAAQREVLPGLPWLLGGLAVLLAAGIVDDRGSLAPGPKLLAQAVAIGVAMTGGWILPTVPIPLTGFELTATWATWPATLLLGLVLINSVNLIDGLDGLAAGLGCVAAFAYAAIAALHGDVPTCLAATALAGCLVGALAWNSHPARVFLGDTGSMAIGFMLHVLGLGLVIGPVDGPTASPFLVLLILVIPWADSGYVMLARLAHGRHPFRGDRSHVHHQVLGLGLDHRMAVLVLVALGTLVAALAVWLRDRPHDTLFLLTVCLAQGIIVGLRYLRRSEAWTANVSRIEAWRHRYLSSQLELQTHPRWSALLALFACGLAAVHLPALFRHAEVAGLTAGAVVLVALLGFAITRRWDHPAFALLLALIGATLALALEAAQWQEGLPDLGTIYAARALTLATFATALVLLWLQRRLHRLIDGPLDLVLLAASACLLWLVRERLPVPPNTILAPALAWYLACRAAAGECGWRRWAVPLAVLVMGAALAAWQVLGRL